jgi:nitronate monooxygenase
METMLTRLLGIEHPVIQAPIGMLSNPNLAAAVSNAGGLGMIAQTWSTLDAIRETIRTTHSLTDRPFGINLIIEEPQDERLEVVLDAGVKIVSFFWGDPSPYVARVHDRGGIVMHTTGSAAEARSAVEAGVDVIVAQGWESGGHVWGEVSTLALVPSVIDASGGVPVAAAGGITDGRGLAAALALGAGAAWMGTRFVASEETPAHPDYLARLLSARETDTFHGRLFDIGWENASHRVLRNRTVESWLAAGCPPSGSRPGEGDVIGHRSDGSDILRYSSISPRADLVVDIEDLSMWSGQGVGLVRDILPAAEIVHRTVAQAASTLEQLGTGAAAH